MLTGVYKDVTAPAVGCKRSAVVKTAEGSQSPSPKRKRGKTDSAVEFKPQQPTPLAACASPVATDTPAGTTDAPPGVHESKLPAAAAAESQPDNNTMHAAHAQHVPTDQPQSQPSASQTPPLDTTTTEATRKLRTTGRASLGRTYSRPSAHRPRAQLVAGRRRNSGSAQGRASPSLHANANMSSSRDTTAVPATTTACEGADDHASVPVAEVPPDIPPKIDPSAEASVGATKEAEGVPDRLESSRAQSASRSKSSSRIWARKLPDKMALDLLESSRAMPASGSKSGSRIWARKLSDKEVQSPTRSVDTVSTTSTVVSVDSQKVACAASSTPASEAAAAPVSLAAAVPAAQLPQASAAFGATEQENEPSRQAGASPAAAQQQPKAAGQSVQGARAVRAGGADLIPAQFMFAAPQIPSVVKPTTEFRIAGMLHSL